LSSSLHYGLKNALHEEVYDFQSPEKDGFHNKFHDSGSEPQKTLPESVAGDVTNERQLAGFLWDRNLHGGLLMICRR
jgi:hypothetical protein